MDPDPALLPSIILFAVSIFTAAAFSGIDIAFISANKIKIEVERKKGFAPSAILSFFFKNPAQFVTSMLLGNLLFTTIYILALCYLTSSYLQPFIDSWHAVLAIQILLSFFMTLLASKLLPRTFFRRNPNRILTLFVIPISIFYIALYPFTKLIISASKLTLRLFGGTKMTKKLDCLLYEKTNLDNYIEDIQKRKQHTHEDERNLKILSNALDFSEIKIRECIVPRTELIAVSVTDSLEHLRKKFSSSGNSKILVYDGSIDNIIGYVHHSKLFELPIASIRRMTKEAPIVPETMTAQKLLAIFIQSNKNLAVVVDEFGGTAGIVTIEDIMEEIFGEIEDEHDKVGLIDKRISDSEFEFSGRIEIDYINEKYLLSIETSEEYETIAGLILHTKGSIPKLNEIIHISGSQFTIIEVSPTRIERIRLKLNAETN